MGIPKQKCNCHFIELLFSNMCDSEPVIVAN